MRTHHIIITLLAIAIWGINFAIIEIGLKEIPPILLSAIRFFLVAFPAVFFIKRPAMPFKWIALYGFIIFSLQFALLFLGMKWGVSAAMASLIMQLQIFITVGLAVLFLGERIHKWQIIGGGVSLAGILIILNHIGTDVSIAGLLMITGAATAWAIGNIIVKKMPPTNGFSLVVWACSVAWIPLLLLSLWIEGPEQISSSMQHVSLTSIASITYLVYASTLFAYSVWSWLVSKYPASTVAPFTLLVPIFGFIGSWAILDETMQAWKILAAVLVLAGLFINLYGVKYKSPKR